MAPAQVGLGYFSPHFPVQVNVETATHPKVTGEQSGCPLHHPAVVDQVKALEETVVGDLSLDLLGPSTGFSW